jgi:hypothetical protein
MAGTIETSRVDVRVDGGSSDGMLVMESGKLVAVLVQVSAEDLGDTATEGGWFLEAGFGPCGLVKTAPPDVFSSEVEALRWIERQLEDDD